ncbi:MAG: DEAD/DEAH box helicase [Bacteroidaceae bacterium]|nr:DEAD/DEAH box helicase [Bacteroidaceae bacterium]
MKSFLDLGLCDALLQAIGEQGYENPMPVQEEVIPFLLEKQVSDDESAVPRDLIALAQTGTGKTAAYGLPVLQLLQDDAAQQPPVPRALIMAPTRELCLQIADDLEGFAKYLPTVRILAVYGGANIEPQIRALKHGVDIIVATPGRLLDLMKRNVANLATIRYVVLDEADEMLSMGFQEDIDAILSSVPTTRRTLLFSATMSREIEHIAQNYLHADARQIQVGSRNEGAENVNHVYYMVHAKDKYLALKRVVDFYPRIYAIIFCRTKVETQEVADNLIRDGYNADALHGDLSQQQRDLTMQKFRQHRTQLLVATDVAARGLDVDDLSHVINYGMPDDVENYTHRSGRTGRAGKKGTSICIIHVREKGKIRLVEKVIRKEFVQGTLPDPKDICAKQLYHVIDEIERVEVEEEEIAPFMSEVQKRWEWLDKDDLIRRVLSREFGRFLRYYANAPEIEDVRTAKKDAGEASGKTRGSRKRKGDHTAEEGYVRLFLNAGKIDGMFAREIIGLINSHVKGDKVEIGRIDLMRNFSFVEVAEKDAARVVKAMRHGVTVKGRSILMEETSAAGKPAPNTDSSRRKPKGKSASPWLETPAKEKKKNKPSREERGYVAPRGKKFAKEDWMKFLHPEQAEKPAADGLKGEIPDFSEEGWARRKPKKGK